MELELEEIEVLFAKPDHSSRIHPDLERKPGGPDNWVEKVGGLPSYIKRIAKHIHSDSGLSISHSIAAAVERVKKLAARGNAQAIAALAQWESKKVRSRALSESTATVVDLGGSSAHIAQKRRVVYSTYGNAVSAKGSGVRGAAFDESKHVRTSGGQFGNKLSPGELNAARRQIEGAITNLGVGENYKLPGNVGWVKRTAGGYFVQGNGGFTASVRTISEAITAAASLLAKKGLDK